MSAPTDTLPTATRVADPGIRALYRQENRWQAWLDVEVALARAQAGLGIIPAAAAEAIAAKAKLDLMDRARIDEGFRRTGHTLVPLVWELGRIVGEPHGGWVHWGATTQNITQTGDLLVQPTGRVLTGTLRTTAGDVANEGTIIAAGIDAARDVLNTGRIEGAAIQVAGAGLQVTDTAAPSADPAAPPLPQNGVLVETRRFAFSVIDQSLGITAGRDIRNQGSGVISTVAQAALPAAYGAPGFSQVPGTPTLRDSPLTLVAGRQVVNEAGATMTATGPIALQAGGGIATAGRIESAGLVAGTSGAVTLRATGGDLVQNGGLIATRGTGALLTLQADAGRITQDGGAVFAAPRLRVQAGTGATLDGPNQFGELIGAFFGAEGGVLRSTGNVVVTGNVASGGNATITAGGALAIGNAGSTPALSSGRGIALVAETGLLTIGASPLQAAGGDLVLSGRSGIALTSTPASVQGNMLLTASAGQIQLTGVQATVQGNLAATASGGVQISGGQVTTGGTLQVTTPGPITVTNAVLTANGGTPTTGLTLLAGSGAIIQGSTLVANNRLTIGENGRIAIGGGTSLSAESAYIKGAVVETGLVTARIGTNMLVQAPGGITNTVPLVVTPRNGAQFPALIYATRTLPVQSADAILANVLPDLPGLTSEQQPTQLRSAPGQQGPNPFFGPAVNAPAGPVMMNIDAGRSPVFLLLDGGIATGTVVAGRVAVHGTGGSADLVGQLSGLVGSEATRASDITRPVEPASLPNYRINSCVVGSINCVVPPRFVPIPPAVRTSVDFIFRPGQINPLDITIPNTGENDYE